MLSRFKAPAGPEHIRALARLVEPVQRRRVVEQDAIARRFVRRPVGQEVEQDGVVGFGVGLFARMRPVTAQTIRSGDACTYACRSLP
jgi:hypothetical protein